MYSRNKLLLCLYLSASLCKSGGASQFIPLGFLGSEVQYSYAAAVDATGKTVVGGTYVLKDSYWYSVAFIWQQSTGMKALDTSNGAASATAITPDGQTIVGSAHTSSF